MKLLPYSLLILCFACSEKSAVVYEAEKFKFPNPVDTKTKEIAYQEKTTYTAGSVIATNNFPAARLNDFSQVNDTLFRATISPENTPINQSPWYAFKIWSAQEQSVYVELNYTEHDHRYHPKLSADGDNWQPIDSTLVWLAEDSVNATMQINIGPDTLWVAAQEIEDHKRVGDWVNAMAQSQYATAKEAGSSVQGRSLYFLDIHNGEVKDKPTVLIISRQHPPEVTGYFAMQAFVETILDNGAQNGFLDKFRVMVYPLMNPDGVDLGHFRHNTGGVDLNRDWAEYNQPEVLQVANHMVRETMSNNNNVALGLDFHSTYNDVYYTFDDSIDPKYPGFTKAWLAQIEEGLNLDDINEAPSGLGSPVSKGWFYQQFGVESITYEIGDGTPRDFIKTKGEVSADAMMNVLMEMVE